ncbi:autotransporter outer membrane beta-barrel domain-containing protein [Limibaculum sp. FT325]|uniref:autotransporter outer membrane beta-barrel domain-containing protein n=1 Tax=Thermohalobaculum sediminis TaxID=2939436 RepID=UPI0020BD8E08|nr:autotransporter outer membrane beta-barrel domain-containing protein [Limibaculum sediminis]MCL5776289.1 autotransporter outer membrane beta-barrel domain-containing protein [Limibaculum sediminis]
MGAEVYSLGQPDTEGGATEGTPNTFIFAFAGVGGTPINGGGSNPHGFLNVYRDVAALIMNSHRRVVGQFTTVDPGARIAVEQVARMSENSQVMSLDASLGKIPLRVYGAVNGEFGNFDRKGSSAGFDYTGGGVTIGADYQLPAGMVGGADIAVGAAFSFQRVSADVDANAGDVDADGYTGSIYAYGAAPMGGMGQLHGELGFSLGYIDYDQTRVSGGQVFSGDPDGMVFSADLEVGYQFDKFPVDEGLGVDLQAGPFVGLSYGFNDVDSFTESGGLAVSSFDDDRLVTTLGGRVSLSKEAEGNIYFGMLEATYNHDFLADGQSVAINGGALTSLLSSPDDDFIGLRALGGVSLNERLRVMLEYNGGYASNSTQHGFLGRLDYAF